MYNKNIDSQDVKSFNHAVGELQSLGTLESLGSREPSAIFSPYQKKGKSASGALDLTKLGWGVQIQTLL